MHLASIYMRVSQVNQAAKVEISPLSFQADSNTITSLAEINAINPAPTNKTTKDDVTAIGLSCFVILSV